MTKRILELPKEFRGKIIERCDGCIFSSWEGRDSDEFCCKLRASVTNYHHEYPEFPEDCPLPILDDTNQPTS